MNIDGSVFKTHDNPNLGRCNLQHLCFFACWGSPTSIYFVIWARRHRRHSIITNLRCTKHTNKKQYISFLFFKLIAQHMIRFWNTQAKTRTIHRMFGFLWVKTAGVDTNIHIYTYIHIYTHTHMNIKHASVYIHTQDWYGAPAGRTRPPSGPPTILYFCCLYK